MIRKFNILKTGGGFPTNPPYSGVGGLQEKYIRMEGG